MKKNFAQWPRTIVSAVAAIAVAVVTPVRAADLVLPPPCIVKVMDDIQLPAVEAGVLVQLSVREGSQVRAGTVIGKIYDSEAMIQLKAAEYGLTAADKRYENDVQIRYAVASAEVAETKFEKMKQANRESSRAVPEIELLQAELEWKASVLSIEKAEHDQDLTKYERDTKRAERDAALLALERRTIHALFNGEVVEILRKQGEWVNPGDPILRLVGFETMWVDGWVEQAVYDPHEIDDCRVTLEIEVARGRKEQISGRIVHVGSLLYGSAQRFLVRAEVPNRQEFGRWLLRPGMNVGMTIHLDTGDPASVDVSQAQ